MKTLMQVILTRHQPKMSKTAVVAATIGGALAIVVLVFLSDLSGLVLLMAPFGASCVLLFALPASPLSQPINVIGGHMVSTSIGIALHSLFPVAWWSIALSVGLAIGVMSLLRVTHPPAGADPIVVYLEQLDISYLVFPVAAGSLCLVLMAWLYHLFSPETQYPLRNKQ